MQLPTSKAVTFPYCLWPRTLNYVIYKLILPVHNNVVTVWKFAIIRILCEFIVTDVALLRRNVVNIIPPTTDIK